MSGTKFVLNKTNGMGVVLKSTPFCGAEIKLLLQGLYYAKVKQEAGKMKEGYTKVYSKIWELFNTGR